MNARMRRIDLICKLFGPLFIALVDGISTETAILVNLGMNTCSVFFEYFAIARVRNSLSQFYPQNTRYKIYLISTLRYTMKCPNCRNQRAQTITYHHTWRQTDAAPLYIYGVLAAKSPRKP